MSLNKVLKYLPITSLYNRPNNTSKKSDLFHLFYAAIFLVSSAVYGRRLIETGKVNPLEQLKALRTNTELRSEEKRVKYDLEAYFLFRKGCGALADLNKDCDMSLEEITDALRIMGVTQGDLERAVEVYKFNRVNRIKELK